MHKINQMQKDQLLASLWENYVAITPSALEIQQLFSVNGKAIHNDHIALRTYNDPRVNISVLEKPFLAAGYEAKGEYVFVEKKLFAQHYEHKTDKLAPKIFISELKLEECSELIQTSVKEVLNNCDQNIFKAEDLILKGRVWEDLSYELYDKLRAESEYAAWMYVYGFCANHFTVNVNELAEFETLQAVNEFLEAKGFSLNASGGKIKGTPEQLLEQSSTLGDQREINFKEGVKLIPSCYYEFALRHKDSSGELYQGFIAASADKIFESTDLKLQMN